MLWFDTWRTTGGRVWRGLGWRLRHVLSRAAERIAGGGLCLALRVRMTRRLPRPLTLALERQVIGGAGYLPFDPALYLERNPDVLQAGQEPLAHYLRYGWIEGRNPNGWLDERRYRRQAGLTPRDRISGLGHYLTLGRARGLGPRIRTGAAGRPRSRRTGASGT